MAGVAILHMETMEPKKSDLLRATVQDLRFGVRSLLKQRGFAAVVLITLALGIGGNVAMFSFVYGVLLQPLPYAEADRIVQLHETHLGNRSGISTLNYLDWKDENQVFDHVAAHASNPVTFTGGAAPVQLRGNQVSADFFQIFGIRAALGRTFAPGEDLPGQPLVVVISDTLWRTQFGADPDLVGRPIRLDGQPHVVIGVLPGGTAIDRSYHQLWRPLVFTAQNRTRNYHWLSAVARLKPGVTLEQARANLDAIGRRIASAHPDTNKDWGVKIAPFRDGMVSGRLRQSLTLLMIAVGAVLLIGCVNVANLFLIRGLARQREVAVRLSLGASRGRLIRQFATEGALLCGLGSGLGLALGYALMTGLNALLPEHAVPAEAEIAINRPVLLFTLGLMIVTTLVCALLPAIRVTRTGLAHALQQHAGRATGGPRQTRWNGLLVVVQVALAFALLATAGLLLRSIQNLQRVDPGVDPTNLLTARLPIDGKRFSEPRAFTAYLREMTERVAALPGVSDVAFAITLPLQQGGYGMGIQIAGEPVAEVSNRPFSFFKPVAPSYFQTVGMRLRLGRSLTALDIKGAPPAVVINQAFAKKYFPDRDPIGQRVLVREVLFGKLGLGADVPWEVVGVVSDERVDGLENEEPSPIVYASQEQSPQMVSQVLIVRGGIAPALMEKQVRAAIGSVNPDQVVTEVKTLEQIKAESLEARRLQSRLLGGFAGVALLLAGLGIYGVLAHGVQQRARELGIRSALGASARQLVGLVLRRGMILVGLGLALGLAVTFATAQVKAGLLFGVSERDPVSLGAGLVLLSGVAWLACYLPARRAAKIDPIICLRCE